MWKTRCPSKCNKIKNKKFGEKKVKPSLIAYAITVYVENSKKPTK